MISKLRLKAFIGRAALTVLAFTLTLSPLSPMGVNTVYAKTAPKPVVSIAPAVKKSTNKICHAKGTRYYNQTKTFTAYKTLKDCIKSGGRLPK